MVLEMRNRTKDISSTWESFDMNPYFERAGGQTLGGNKGGGSNNEKVDVLGPRPPSAKGKADNASPRPKKTSFLERLKNRSSKLSASTASTAEASTWASTASSTATTTGGGKDGALYSPTLTEELQLDKCRMVSKDPLSNPPPCLQMDDMPSSSKKQADNKNSNTETNAHRGRKEQEKRKAEEANESSSLDLEQYACLFIPPPRPTGSNGAQQSPKEQREACMQFALEDFRETVTTSMNQAIHLWSRVQSIFFHESSASEAEEIKRRMARDSAFLPHPTTVFITPKQPMEKQEVVANTTTLESLADSLTNPTFLEDVDDDVSSLTEPPDLSSLKPIPPLFRMRKPNASTSTPNSRKPRKQHIYSAPVKEIHIKLDDADQQQAEQCIDFTPSSPDEKEPYDEKDELFDEALKENAGPFNSIFEPFMTSLNQPPSCASQTPSEISFADRLRKFIQPYQKHEPTMSFTLQPSSDVPAAPAITTEPLSVVDMGDMESVSC